MDSWLPQSGGGGHAGRRPNESVSGDKNVPEVNSGGDGGIPL